MRKVRVPRHLLEMCIGQVTRKNTLWNAARVRVYDLKLDEFLCMYFNSRFHIWAADPTNKCKEGDIVRLTKLRPKQSDRIHHEVAEVPFPVGQTIDPVTGKQCRGVEFVDPEFRTFKPIFKQSNQQEVEINTK